MSRLRRVGRFGASKLGSFDTVDAGKGARKPRVGTGRGVSRLCSFGRFDVPELGLEMEGLDERIGLIAVERDWR